MIAVLNRENKTAVQALLTSPEKISKAIAIFGTHKLGDAGMVQMLWDVCDASVSRDSATTCGRRFLDRDALAGKEEREGGRPFDLRKLFPRYEMFGDHTIFLIEMHSLDKRTEKKDGPFD